MRREDVDDLQLAARAVVGDARSVNKVAVMSVQSVERLSEVLERIDSAVAKRRAHTNPVQDGSALQAQGCVL